MNKFKLITPGGPWPKEFPVFKIPHVEKTREEVEKEYPSNAVDSDAAVGEATKDMVEKRNKQEWAHTSGCRCTDCLDAWPKLKPRFMLRARWFRYWHCLFHTFGPGRHRMETVTMHTVVTIQVGCECGRTWG